LSSVFREEILILGFFEKSQNSVVMVPHIFLSRTYPYESMKIAGKLFALSVFGEMLINSLDLLGHYHY